MSVQVTHEAVITLGTYKDRQTGEEKKRYQKIGVVFTDDQGRMSLKLDALPCGPSWSGYISLYPKNQAQQSSESGYPIQSYQKAPDYRTKPSYHGPPEGSDLDSDEEIPF